MNKAATQSEVYSSELNCLSAVRENTKLVVGSGEGILYLFNQVKKNTCSLVSILCSLLL